MSSALVSQILGIAKVAVPLLVPGSGPALALGTKLVESLGVARNFASSGAERQEVETTQATVDQAMTAMNEHADRVAGKLGDEPSG